MRKLLALMCLCVSVGVLYTWTRHPYGVLMCRQMCETRRQECSFVSSFLSCTFNQSIKWGSITKVKQADINCKENFQGFGNSCYLFSDDTLNWKEAKTKCEQLGTHLVVINDDKEDTFLKRILGIRGDPKDAYYVGASDIDSEGNWQWVDGKKNPYTNWYPNQPNRGRRQNCLNLWYSYDFGWDDEVCNKRHRYICEYQL